MVDISSIKIDLERDKLFDELGIKRLQESYMRETESSPQERFAFVSAAFASNDGHAQRLYDYSSKHWLSYSTPILSFGRSKRGLPISCFLPYLDDSAEGLVNTLSEVNWLSMLGGGVGIGLGIRSADDKSVGIMPHLRTYDASSLAYRQGRTRRGSYAAYLDISHPDIFLFLEMRKPTGDPNLRTLNLHHGINITDDFMHIIEQAMLDPHFDDTWELKDPHSGEVKDKVSARELWQRILETRMLTGEPYIHFIDTSNRAMPQFLKDLGLKIHQSNLCSEIILPTDEKRTAVCCLSSLNLETYDEWKNDNLFLIEFAYAFLAMFKYCSVPIPAFAAMFETLDTVFTVDTGTTITGTDVLMHLLEVGDHVVSVDDVYGGTSRLFRTIWSRHGVETTFADLTERPLSDFVTAKTKMVWIETPTNPLLKIIDIQKVVAEAKKLPHRPWVIVDNTFASPYFQSPLELGADVARN